LLGVARVFVLVGLGAVSALVVRQVTGDGAIVGLLVTLGVLAALTPLLHWWESWISHDMAFRLLAEMRIDLYRKLDRLAPSYLVSHRSGDIMSAVTTDVETVELFFAHTVAPAFVALAVPISVLVVIGIIEWPLALVLLPFLVVVAYLPFRARDELDRLGLASRQQLGEVNAHMVDGIQGMREILAFGRQRERLDEVTAQQRRYGEHRMRFFRLLTGQRVMIEVAMGLGGIAVLGTGAYLASVGSMPFELLPLTAIIAYTTFIPISEVAQVGRQLADTLGSSRRIFSIHDEPVPVSDGPGFAGSLSVPQGSVALNGVRFAYGPGLTPALDGVSFTIEPGQTVALIGRSGAGKTTTAHLLMRFWDPQAGGVSLDGHDLRAYRLDDLRQKVSLVAQDTYLFNSSIRDNLLVANPTATESEMVEAATMAAADEFITALPDGYDTTTGERGVQLSGGQRQRIAIARAFLKNSQILILDEATSHLDAESEALIHSSLERLMSGRSTMVIAHRLSTIRAADKIVVLDAGRVAEEGSHADLMGRGGLYRRLVSAQISAARGS
jgi:ATP-binding cassette subfamily C protein CydCD